MDRDKILSLIEPLRESKASHGRILKEFIRANDVKIAGYVMPLVLPEITSSFGIESLKIPESFIPGVKPDALPGDIYSAVILPDTPMPCCMADFSSLPVYRFSYPSGYGEDAAVSLHNETAAMLRSLYDIDLKSIDIELLQKKTELFENMRRAVRSICAIRAGNTGLMTIEELSLIFEISQIFPVTVSLELIMPILDELKKIKPEPGPEGLKALFYGTRGIPPHIADFIESRGITLVEDDTCCGRRFFDISLNPSSEFIFYELLDAYSYRPMCPCTRNVEERYELLYKLLRNYGINPVIFYKDDCCGISAGDISYLRIRMMRDGIDPLVIDGENYIDTVESYIGRI